MFLNNSQHPDFFSTCQTLFSVVDLDGYFLQLNAAWQNLGFNPGQLPPESFLELTHPDDLATTQACLSQLQAGGLSVTFANRFRHKEGTYHQISWQMTRVVSEVTCYAVGMLHSGEIKATTTPVLEPDLAAPHKSDTNTPKKLSSSPVELEILKLRQKVNDLQTILEGLQEAIVVQSANGQLQTLNSRVEHILGMAMETSDFDLLWQTVNQKPITDKPVPISFQTTSGNGLKLLIRPQVLSHHNTKVMSFLDVTALYQQELAAQQLKQNLEFVMQSKGEGLLEWNLRNNQVHYSSQWKNLLGYTQEDLGTQINVWYSRIHPTDHPTVLKEVKNCLEGLTSVYNKTHRLQHKDGSYRWMHSQGAVWRDNKGQPYRYLIAFVDITEAKRVEQSLETSRKYEHILLALGEATLLLDHQSKIVEANPSACQFYGYSRQELLQLKGSEVFLSDWKWTESRLVQATYHRNKAGRLIPVEVMISSFLWQSQKWFVMTVRDVTSIRESIVTLTENEARYRLLFDAHAEAVIVFDTATLQVLEANPVARRLYGYTRDKWLRLHVEDILADPTQSLTPLRLAGKQKNYKIAIDWHRKGDGTVFPVEISTGSYKLKDRTLVCTILRDLTERLKMEEDSQKALKFVNALIQTSPAFFITITPAGKITMLNDTLLKNLGYTAEEVIGKDYLTLLIPEADRPVIFSNMNALINQHEERMLSEMTILAKNGRPLLVECHCRIMLDAKGQVEYLFAVGIDIGERRQVLQELQMFKTIVEHSNEAIAIRGADRTLIYINLAHQKLFKHSFEEARQSHYRDYLPSTKTSRNVNQEIRNCIEKQKITWEGVLDMVDTQGQSFPVWARFDAVYDEQGQVLFAFSMMHDISEHQSMEADLRYEREQYETIFHSAPLMIFYKDRESRFIRVNRYAAKIFETTPEEMEGKSDEDVMPEFAKQYQADDKEVMRSGKPKLAIIERYPKGYLRTDKIPYLDAAGKISGVMVFSMDITERIQAELALRYEHEQYETIFHTAPLSILYKDKENRIIRANLHAATQMGVHVKQLEGMSLYDLSPDHAKEYHTSDLEVICSGRPKLGLIEKNRSGFSQVDKIPYRDAEGNIQGVIVFSMNITKRVKMEQALRQKQQVLQESEMNLRMALETLPTMLYAIDGKFNFVLWNRECEQVTGYTAAEIINNPNAWELLYPNPEYREEMLITTREMVENYAGFRDWEWILTCKDGMQKTILWSGSSDAQTLDFLLCAVGQDITEHDQVLQILCDSEERLRQVIENMPVMLVAYDERGQLIMWNRFCEKVMGYKSTEIVRNPKALEWLYPQAAYREKIQEQQKNGPSYTHWETEMTCKHGESRIIAWSNVSKEYPIPGWFGWMIGEDLTEIRKTQQVFSHPETLLAEILNGIHPAICVTDGRGRFVYVNTRYCQLYGYNVSELIGKTFSVVIPSGYHQTGLRHYFRFLTNPYENSFQGTWETVNRDEKVFKIQFVAQRVELWQTYVVWTVETV